MPETIDLVLKAIGLTALLVAFQQLYEVKRKRMVDMYWKISDMYLSSETTETRAAVHGLPSRIEGFEAYLKEPGAQEPSVKEALIEEYRSLFHDAKEGSEESRMSRLARMRIRFLNQAGILVKRSLIDRDLLFGLIGSGLEIDFPILEIVIEGHRRAHSFPRLYDHLEILWHEYHDWKTGRGPGL